MDVWEVGIDHLPVGKIEEPKNRRTELSGSIAMSVPIAN